MVRDLFLHFLKKLSAINEHPKKGVEKLSIRSIVYIILRIIH